MLLKRKLAWSMLSSAALLFGPGCGGTTGAKPDDMSAQAHRQEANVHEDKAQKEAAQYDPDAERVDTLGTGASNPDLDFGVAVYNPTEGHRLAAERHQRHAEDHRAAAAELERFEEAQCGSFPASTRRLCPLLGQVASVEQIPNGARVNLAEGANAEAIEAHVRCHIAFARTRGREGMDECPLYVKGVQVGSVESGVMELVAENSDAAKQILQRTETHVGEGAS